VSQYLVFALLSYLMLLPTAWVLYATTRPPRFRVAGLAVPDFVPSSTDSGGLY
jgi:hypothetical protein